MTRLVYRVNCGVFEIGQQKRGMVGKGSENLETRMADGPRSGVSCTSDVRGVTRSMHYCCLRILLRVWLGPYSLVEPVHTGAASL